MCAWSEEEGEGCHKTDLLLSCSQGLTPEIMNGWKSQGDTLSYHKEEALLEPSKEAVGCIRRE